MSGHPCFGLGSVIRALSGLWWLVRDWRGWGGYVQEENEAEEEVLDGVSAVISVALRKWGDVAFPFVDPLMPAIGQVCRPSLHPSPVLSPGDACVSDIGGYPCWRTAPRGSWTTLSLNSRYVDGGLGR